MRYLICFFSVLWALSLTTAFAQDGNTQKNTRKVAAEEFASALQSLSTLSGNFKQRIVDAESVELQVTEGEFHVKRPGYFFWKVAPPYEQLVIGTPDTLKVYDPDLEQLNIYPGDSLLGTPAALISGNAQQISEQYDVAYKNEGNKNVFSLTQKLGQESAFASLTFTFSQQGEGRLIEHMVFVDNLGQKTEVALSAVKMNKAVANSVFDFEPPKGTDIIIDG